ncbi:MAG: FAD-dependent oxidoreductase [Planctomycetota bacterium]
MKSSGAKRRGHPLVAHPCEVMTNPFTIERLPLHLRERTRALSEGSAGPARFILYWMRAAARAAENPALDVCLELARQIDLARARTDEPLWDAAQLSLLRHGELHNDVRMTWGKQLLGWTEDPQRALELAIDLNHRFALDGRDPASYGGILWCFGQFDRPFTPEQPVLGTTRPRPIENHARRLDVAAYRRRTERTAGREPGPIAVLGAGVAGLTCARILTDQGLRVTVFDKSRGTGGRMATRRVGEARFDLGAPFFTARTALRRLTRSWIEDGLVSPISGPIVRIRGREVDAASPEPRYRGVPGMSAITRHLADRVSLRAGHRIASLHRTPEGWELEDDRGEVLGAYPLVLIALPAEQAVPLLQASKDLARMAASIRTAPCLVRAVSFAKPIDLPFEAAFVERDPDLTWLSRSQGGEHWLLHSTPELAESCFDESPEKVTDRLLRAMERVTGCEIPTPDFVHAHRWRYAKVMNPLDVGALFDEKLGLGACGDWCRGARVEGAFQSGVALAGRVLGWCADGRSPIRQGELFE